VQANETNEILKELLAGENFDEEFSHDTDRVREAYGLSEDEIYTLAELEGSAALKVFIRFFKRRVAAVQEELRSDEVLQGGDRVIADRVRNMAALQSVVDELEYFPRLCRKSIQYTASERAGEPEEEE
jgi:hypothetical protein